MKKLITGLIIGFILGTLVSVSIATVFSTESIWNGVYDKTTKTIAVRGV